MERYRQSTEYTRSIHTQEIEEKAVVPISNVSTMAYPYEMPDRLGCPSIQALMLICRNI